MANAQNAGAIGTIVYSLYSGSQSPGSSILDYSGSTDTSVIIPSLEVSQADGGIIKNALENSENVTVIMYADPNLWSTVFKPANWIFF